MYLGISQGIPLVWTSDSTLSQQLKGDPSTINDNIDDWLRFLIGTLMKADPVPLTLSSGRSSRLTITKMDERNKDVNVGEVEFDSKTGYPSVVRHTRIVKDTIEMSTTGEVFTVATYPVTYEMRFRNRTSVNGIMFPGIITLASQRIDIDMRIEEVQINPNLSIKDFEIPN